MNPDNPDGPKVANPGNPTDQNTTNPGNLDDPKAANPDNPTDQNRRDHSEAKLVRPTYRRLAGKTWRRPDLAKTTSRPVISMTPCAGWTFLPRMPWAHRAETRTSKYTHTHHQVVLVSQTGRPLLNKFRLAVLKLKWSWCFSITPILLPCIFLRT